MGDFCRGGEEEHDGALGCSNGGRGWPEKLKNGGGWDVCERERDGARGEERVTKMGCFGHDGWPECGGATT